MGVLNAGSPGTIVRTTVAIVPSRKAWIRIVLILWLVAPAQLGPRFRPGGQVPNASGARAVLSKGSQNVSSFSLA